jgi:hypothetical protein
VEELPFWVLQDSGNCGHRVPITCRCSGSEDLVELAKVANRFHFAPVQTKDEPVFRGKDLQGPFAAGRKTEGRRKQWLPAFRQNAHKPNDLWSRGLTRKRVPGRQIEHIVTLADHHLAFERQLPKYFRTQFGLADLLPHYESSGGANVHNAEVFQFICHEAGPKSSMAPDIDSPQKDDQRHDALILNQQSAISDI